MKVKDLLSILENLDPDLDVKMYLFTQVPMLPSKDTGALIPLRVDTFVISDVLISNFGNSVLLSSKQF